VIEAHALAGRRVLITGGAGYLGTAIAHALSEVDVTLVRLARPGAARPPLTGRARVEELSADVRDPGVWERALPGVDVVLHLAAQTSAYVAERDPLADLDANVRPLLALLDACRRASLRPVVVAAGTATQAGLTPQLPVDESVPDRPITIYDLHKLAAERYLEHHVRAGAVRGATLRLANVYGPGPRSGAPDRGVLNLMVRRALSGQALTVYGDGAFVRDYVFVDDVARAFLAAAARVDRVDGRHFVVGSGCGATIAEAVHLVADTVARLTGRPPVAVTHVPPPPGLLPIEERSFVADTAAFRAATGWEPRVTLAEGVEATVRHALAEPARSVG